MKSPAMPTCSKKCARLARSRQHLDLLLGYIVVGDVSVHEVEPGAVSDLGGFAAALSATRAFL